jgi:uncharacterized protein YoxC
MSSLDILYYSLSLAALVVAGSFAYLAYNLVQTLKEIDLVLEDVKDTTQDIQSMKNTIKLGVSNLAGRFLGKIAERR